MKYRKIPAWAGTFNEDPGGIAYVVRAMARIDQYHFFLPAAAASACRFALAIERQQERTLSVVWTFTHGKSRIFTHLLLVSDA
jgi:hypothetical protein